MFIPLKTIKLTNDNSDNNNDNDKDILLCPKDDCLITYDSKCPTRSREISQYFES